MVETKSVDVLATITAGTISEVSRLGGTIVISGGTTYYPQEATSPYELQVSINKSNIMVPIDVQARLYASEVLFSSTVVAAGGTLTSGWYDISQGYTKTISYLSTGSAGTLVIHVTPTSSTATARIYYTDNSVASGTYTTKSFTEAFYFSRIQYVPTSAATVDAWIGRMS